jgi:hypothetical protein
VYSRLNKTYFSKYVLVIFHTSLALMLTCSYYKSITAVHILFTHRDKMRHLSYQFSEYSLWFYVTVAAQSEVNRVFNRLKIGIVGSNLSRDMDVSVFVVLDLSCAGRGLVMGQSPVKGVLKYS